MLIKIVVLVYVRREGLLGILAAVAAWDSGQLHIWMLAYKWAGKRYTVRLLGRNTKQSCVEVFILVFVLKNIHYSIFNIHYSIFIIHYSIFNIQYSLFNFQYSIFNIHFFEASYVSMVFVWITTLVSAFCQYSLLVVIVRVTLHELNPNAIAKHVTIAVAIVTTIL